MWQHGVCGFIAGLLRTCSCTRRPYTSGRMPEGPAFFQPITISPRLNGVVPDTELEELFQRLQLGTPLNTAEKLNAIGGDLRDFCHDKANKPFFAEKIALKDTRYAHFESVLRWVFIEAREVQPQMRFPQLESLLKDNRAFSQSSDTASRVAASVDYLDKAFPNKCSYLRNRANTLSICLLASRVISQHLDRGSEQKFSSFVEDFFTKLAAEVEKGSKSTERELLRYQHAITSGSTGGDSIRTRNDILTKRLATFAPEFSRLLGAYQDATDELSRNLTELMESIRDEIYKVNSTYAVAHGEDLFKMTNKSVAAFQKLSVPSRDVQQYGDLIDALYCLIYEGSGSCNRLPTPPPQFAMDVKILRTDLRHDMDHGKASEIARKRKRNAEVFARYAGKPTPGECSPEDFLAAHVRLLQSTMSFLQHDAIHGSK